MMKSALAPPFGGFKTFRKSQRREKKLKNPLSSDAAFLNAVEASRDQHFWLLLASQGSQPAPGPPSCWCQNNSVHLSTLEPPTSLEQPQSLSHI